MATQSHITEWVIEDKFLGASRVQYPTAGRPTNTIIFCPNCGRTWGLITLSGAKHYSSWERVCSKCGPGFLLYTPTTISFRYPPQQVMVREALLASTVEQVNPDLLLLYPWYFDW